MTKDIGPGRLVVICGPSGSGKTSVIERLRADERVSVSVSVTTRAPRADEVEGRDYHFVTRDDFLAMVDDDAFVETCEVFRNGDLYGSTWAGLRDGLSEPDSVYIMEVDLRGMRSLRDEAGLEMTSLFIAPPSMEELEQRLRRRGTETDEQITRRLNRAREELDEAHAEQGVNVIVNTDIDQAVREIVDLLGLEDSAALSPSAADEDTPTRTNP